MNTTQVAAAVTEVRRNFEVSVLPAFNEIAETYLKAFHRSGYATMQRYLDSRIAIGGVYYRRRAVLLAVHDMKEDVEAPAALQERADAELKCLQMRPKPKLKLYRDIATAILRMEVMIRSRASRPLEHGEGVRH
jgi:hypothetical protein